MSAALRASAASALGLFGGLAPLERLRAATIFFEQGTPTREVFFIESGVVKLSHIADDGHEIIVDLRSRGRLLGIAPALLGIPHPASARALTDCSVQRVSQARLVSALRSDPELSQRVHLAQGREAVENLGRFAEMAVAPAHKRLERLLAWFETECNGDFVTSSRSGLPLKHWELAQFLSVTPAYLSRMLARMEGRGRLRLDRRRPALGSKASR